MSCARWGNPSMERYALVLKSTWVPPFTKITISRKGSSKRKMTVATIRTGPKAESAFRISELSTA